MSKWIRIVGFLVAFFALVSCKSRMADLKPAPEPEVYRVLPPNDSRNFKPIDYHGTLHEDPYANKKSNPLMKKPSRMSGMGMQPGMGQMGGGYGR